MRLPRRHAANAADAAAVAASDAAAVAVANAMQLLGRLGWCLMRRADNITVAVLDALVNYNLRLGIRSASLPQVLAHPWPGRSHVPVLRWAVHHGGAVAATGVAANEGS